MAFLIRRRVWCILAVVSCYSCGGTKTSSPETEYSAVLLVNGQVFVGKLDKLGDQYPVLTDVYYVREVTDPDSKKASNVLVKRGSEWHAPNRTILNASQIVLVEPVSRFQGHG